MRAPFVSTRYLDPVTVREFREIILDLNRQREAYIRQNQPTAPGGFDDARFGKPLFHELPGGAACFG